nr:MAG TPA: hypothetical protein [Caudoviricetes sp.]
MIEIIKRNLALFVSRKLFFSLFVFLSCCVLLDRGKLVSTSFEMITISIVAAYLTSNVATRYTVGRDGFTADSYGQKRKALPSPDEETDEEPEEESTMEERGFMSKVKVSK